MLISLVLSTVLADAFIELCDYPSTDPTCTVNGSCRVSAANTCFENPRCDQTGLCWSKFNQTSALTLPVLSESFTTEAGCMAGTNPALSVVFNDTSCSEKVVWGHSFYAKLKFSSSSAAKHPFSSTWVFAMIWVVSFNT